MMIYLVEYMEENYAVHPRYYFIKGAFSKYEDAAHCMKVMRIANPKASKDFVWITEIELDREELL